MAFKPLTDHLAARPGMKVLFSTYPGKFVCGVLRRDAYKAFELIDEKGNWLGFVGMHTFGDGRVWKYVSGPCENCNPYSGMIRNSKGEWCVCNVCKGFT